MASTPSKEGVATEPVEQASAHSDTTLHNTAESTFLSLG